MLTCHAYCSFWLLNKIPTFSLSVFLYFSLCSLHCLGFLCALNIDAQSLHKTHEGLAIKQINWIHFPQTLWPSKNRKKKEKNQSFSWQKPNLGKKTLTRTTSKAPTKLSDVCIFILSQIPWFYFSFLSLIKQTQNLFSFFFLRIPGLKLEIDILIYILQLGFASKFDFFFLF